MKSKKRNPHSAASRGASSAQMFAQAVYEFRSNNLQEAQRLGAAALEADKNNIGAHHLMGVLQASQLDFDGALKSFDRALKISPRVPDLLAAKGTVLNEMRRHDDALKCFEQALATKSDHLGLLESKGATLLALRRFEEALDVFDAFLPAAPSNARVLNNRAMALAGLGRDDDASEGFRQAIAIEPQNGELWVNLGGLLERQKRYADALEAYDRAITLRPNFAEAWNGHGNVFGTLTRYHDALIAYDKALSLDPDLAQAWAGRGNVLYSLRQYGRAADAFERALQLDPGLAVAWFGRGLIFDKAKERKRAADAFAEVLRRDPHFPFAKGRLIHQKMLCCDWSDIDRLVAEIENDIVAGVESAEPFGWQGLAVSERSLQHCARIYAASLFPAAVPYACDDYRGGYVDDRKIRVGYLSGEIRNQATSHLLVGALENHNREEFEVFIFDNGWDDGSDPRKRIAASADIVDIAQLSDDAAVDAIGGRGIDILVNLNGYFGEYRMNVFARRPAPIQVNYLGFPGTLGAGYIDYIIADRHVIPEDRKDYYDEKVVYLPNSYQPNDDKKRVGDNSLTREAAGLPEGALVFCCFNKSYKITPDMFESWMRILSSADGSVLWLIEDNATVVSNLKKEAEARGVSAERLVFAPRTDLADHLARHQLADLFLDTLPYNAHTTASDALWAGVPVLTQYGTTFPDRVGASLLNATGVGQLITHTREEYEKTAIQLAADPSKIAALKRALAGNRHTSALFDTGQYTRHLEAAYVAMHRRRKMGLPADHIDVPR